MAALIRIDHSAAFGAAGKKPMVRFCSRCGEPGEDRPRGESPPLQGRVCPACGMGMLLRCAHDAAPASQAPFLIVKSDLKIVAISQTAEYAFGEEALILGSRLTDLLASPLGEVRFGRTVAQAATRNRDPVVMPVKAVAPATGLAGMLAASIATCGPPRAALVTVEPSGFGRRR